MLCLNAKTQRRKGLEIVDHLPQPLNETWGIEVEKQAQPFVHELEVGEQLCHMNRQDLLDSLDFHDDFVLDQQIEPVTVVQLEFVVEDRHDLLGDDVQPGVPQFMNETGPVNALQKAWSEF